MPAAQRDITVVAADLGLRAGMNGMTFHIDAQVHRRLPSAIANGLKLDEGVGQSEERRRPGKQIAEEVGAQPIAKHGYLQFVGYPAKLEHLLAAEELRLVDQDAVELALDQFLDDGVEQMGVVAK